MQGPAPEAVNTRPKPRPTSTTDPAKATKISVEWSMPVEAMFIADVVAEHARVLDEAERRMRREELLDDSSAGPFDPAKFSANGPQVYIYIYKNRYHTWYVLYCNNSLNCFLVLIVHSRMYVLSMSFLFYFRTRKKEKNKKLTHRTSRLPFKFKMSRQPCMLFFGCLSA